MDGGGVATEKKNAKASLIRVRHVAEGDSFVMTAASYCDSHYDQPLTRSSRFMCT